MSSDKKKQERQWLQIAQSRIVNFPDGVVSEFERPDFLVYSPEGKIGIEITRIHQRPSSQVSRSQESERQKLADKACSIYEQSSTIKAEVKIYIGGSTAFSNRNIGRYAVALIKLVIANMPPENDWIMFENHYDDPDIFPYEISAISIIRLSALTRNFWSVPSGGAVQEDFIHELEEVITTKDKLLATYAADCISHWLIVVAENNSPSTFLDPSATTINHEYRSSFDRVFLLEAFRQKISELTVTPPIP